MQAILKHIYAITIHPCISLHVENVCTYTERTLKFGCLRFILLILEINDYTKVQINNDLNESLHPKFGILITIVDNSFKISVFH